MKYEILAPAGSMESLVASVRSGANAVYLGGKAFNARRNAGNFDNEQLNEAVEYCHKRGVKVYLTLNIVVGDDEFGQLYELVKTALEAGVDAFIVQDVGVAKFIKGYFKNARLHGSTQMSIMSSAGAKFAKEMGFSRIVLPREMTLEEIQEIRKSTDIELEVFVHGALCMCVSGQCYLSSMIGSRSGNRGLCAQPCRLPFTAKNDKNECALSLKDLSLIDHISQLDGVTSLKIEGRMKRPEYVSASVTAVKKAIEGSYSQEDYNILKSVFSRSGFTDGYFTGKRQDMFGTRQKEDVVSAKNVLKAISHNYDNENPLLPISMKFTCRAGERAILWGSALDKAATILGDTPDAAINKPMSSDSIIQRLSKLGATQFYPDSITADVDDGLILPAAKINEMRRQLVDELTRIERGNIEYKQYTPSAYNAKSCTPYLTASFSNTNQIPNKHPFKEIYIPIDSTIEDFIDNSAGVIIPRGIFGMEEKIKEKLIKLKKAGITKALCPNSGAYQMAIDLGFEATGDFGLNVYNSTALEHYGKSILSFELSLEQANKINGGKSGVIVYGRAPLMLTRNCPIKNSIGCEACKKKGKLTDRKGFEFPVMCSNYSCVELLNCVPIFMLDKMDQINTDFAHFYFSTESMAEVEKIIELYKNKQAPDFKFTRGLYYRGTK